MQYTASAILFPTDVSCCNALMQTFFLFLQTEECIKIENMWESALCDKHGCLKDSESIMGGQKCCSSPIEFKCQISLSTEPETLFKCERTNIFFLLRQFL